MNLMKGVINMNKNTINDILDLGKHDEGITF